MLHKKIIRFKSGIYIITNLINNKKYVGSSINIYNRFHTHCSKLKCKTHSSKHLQNAYHKYGFDNFLFEVLEYCDKLDLVIKEQYYIDSIHPEYNKRKDVTSNFTPPMTDEAKLRMSNTLKERYKNGLVPYKQQHRWVTVYAYTLEGKYISKYNNYEDCGKSLQINPVSISRAARNIIKSIKGYQICTNFTPQKEGLKIIHHKSRPIIYDDQEYVSLSQMCKKLNINRGSISKAIRRHKYKGKNLNYKFPK